MIRYLPALLMLTIGTAASGQSDCRLCYSDTSRPGERPLTLEISSDLNFAKLALTGTAGGSAELDAGNGAKRTGGTVISLGGMAITGRGRVTGEPLRAVRVDLPQAVAMTGGDGNTAELTGFTTDLPSHPVLDANGELTFSFGARLILRDGRGGNYRGRIPITVDYN